jgi:hypothetical protein
VSTIGFLHTSPVHLATFDGLLHSADSGLRSVAVVDEALLSDAQAYGPDNPRVIGGIEAALDQLEQAGAAVIVCTCSMLGGVAESVGSGRTVPVLRVDRAMAAAAVQLGPQVAVVAAVEGTLAPTRALIETVASELRVPITITLTISEGAWARFHHAVTRSPVVGSKRWSPAIDGIRLIRSPFLIPLIPSVRATTALPVPTALP